jgi:AcrR family transcriptional regulator
MAGGSLATLYAQFGNKEGLFLAVLQDQFERFARNNTPPANVDHLSLEEGLQVIGEQFVRSLLDPDSLAFFRVIVGEGRKFPDQLQRYVQAGSDRIRTLIGRFLRARGAKVEDPDMAASYLMELWRSRHQYLALADGKYRLTDEQLSAHVASVVRFFLARANP